jgi:FkbM family methyltransferase
MSSKENKGLDFKYKMKNILDIILDKSSIENDVDTIRLSINNKDDIKKYWLNIDFDKLDKTFIEKEKLDKMDEENYNIDSIKLENTEKEIFVPYCSDNTSFDKEVAISNMTSKNFMVEKVLCRTLDDFLIENPIDIGLVKIDVQGFEMNVLKGMSNFLEKSEDVTLIIEWDEKHTKQAGHSLDEMMNFLTQRNFVNTESLPGDKIFKKNKKD